MRHLSLPLADAYLLVRSRRLSVLIQPNIRLFFDLLAWEIHIARERLKVRGSKMRTSSSSGNDAPIVSQEVEFLTQELHQALCWPFLAREIYRLNAKYIR
jgi:dual specificity MAP kinase phosphatase